MDKRKLDWLWLNGMHDVIKFIDNSRIMLYNKFDKEGYDLRAIILEDFIK